MRSPPVATSSSVWTLWRDKSLKPTRMSRPTSPWVIFNLMSVYEVTVGSRFCNWRPQLPRSQLQHCITSRSQSPSGGQGAVRQQLTPCHSAHRGASQSSIYLALLGGLCRGSYLKRQLYTAVSLKHFEIWTGPGLAERKNTNECGSHAQQDLYFV